MPSFIHQSLHFVTADAGYGNMTKNILLVQQKLKGMGSGTREVYVVRPNCGRPGRRVPWCARGARA